MARERPPSTPNRRAASRRAVPLGLAMALAGCFEDSTPIDPGDAGTSTVASSSSGSGGPGGSGVDPPPTATSVDATGPTPETGTDASSDDTGPPPAVCGDGIVAPGELCWSAPVTIEGGGPAYDLHMAELDGDGWLDVVISIPTMATLMLGDGAGGFVAQPPLMVIDSGTGGGNLALARLDPGDAIDLVASNGASLVTGLLGDGRGGFAPPVATLVPGVNADGLVPGDYTNDGVTDLLVQRTSGYDVYFGEGLGNGAFAFTSQLSVTEPGRAIAGDFDGDGNLDALVGQSAAQTLVWLRGNGSSAMTPQGVPFGPGLGYGRPSAADLDGDGTDDAAFPLGDADQVAVVRGAAGMGPTAPVLLDTTGEPAATAMADVDADGTLDVVACGRGLFATLSVWQGDGAGGLGPVHEHPITPCEHLVVGDVDGDGALDVVYHEGGPGGLRVVLAEP